jgi:hypothetical protein
MIRDCRVTNIQGFIVSATDLYLQYTGIMDTGREEKVHLLQSTEAKVS